MEVGAVKQAFNNEVILMKKNLNQAKIQVIHKLTRKAKTLTEKRVPEKLQVKLRKKAESAVKEVLIIKKIKAKDIAKFIVTHQGELNSYLNKPEVDINKACARLLLHKSLQTKYKSIRSTFGNTSIEDLLMSRLERRKLKKEAREKQKDKKKAKELRKLNNGGSGWEVEEINNGNAKKNKNLENDDHEMEDDDHEMEDDDHGIEDDYQRSSKRTQSDQHIDDSAPSDSNDGSESEHEETNMLTNDVVDNNLSKPSKNKLNPRVKSVTDEILVSDNIVNVKKEAKIVKDRKKKDVTKNKNFNEKILKRNFKKDVSEKAAQEVKIVDPFFITSTGENYMSVVEPRRPDEIKEVHQEGNRKYRRAVMFGHIPKQKPRKDSSKQNNRKIGGNTNYNNDRNTQNNSFNRSNSGKDESENVEKLHPSWAAKKKVSSLLPFEGRKTVFNDDD